MSEVRIDAPIQCRAITIVKARRDSNSRWNYIDRATRGRPQVGDIFYARHYLKEPYRSDLTDKYWRDHAANRPPIVVVVPGAVWFPLDVYAHTEDGTQGEGWNVSGELPRITVTPSLHAVGIWHGFLTDGWLRQA